MLDIFLELLKTWGGCILSSISIVGGLFMFLLYDRKIKSQSKILNDLQIRRLKEDNVKNSKAKILVSINQISSYEYEVVIKNIGSSDAHNVRVEKLCSISDLESLDCEDEWGPYDVIYANSKVVEQITVTCDSPDIFQIKIIWDDDYQKNQSCVFKLRI